ncbi:MAG: transglycosylase SLT domain-containing protein [Burkholderiales bacterium]|nr:transglycosylase SLT domain-containing protein [Burkholderiales bacterium]
MPKRPVPTVDDVKRRIVATLGLLLVAAAVAAPPRMARAQNGGAGSDDLAVQAREAFRAKDKTLLFTLRHAAAGQGHALSSWIEYWELGNRLAEAQPGEFDAFAERWRGTYVEDRLRNDWLLELGRRREWAALRAEFPRFRMNDDREVTCYALLATHFEGLQDVRVAARNAWLAQRDSDDGCQLLAATLVEQRIFGVDEVWQALRAAVELSRPRLARERAALLDAGLAAAVDALFKDPAKLLRDRRGVGASGANGSRSTANPQLAVLALWRLAATDPDLAFTQLDQYEAARLPAAELARAWAGVARQAAFRQHPKAADFAQRAFAALDKAAAGTTRRAPEPAFSDETLAWMARAALRAPGHDRHRWTLLLRTIDEMSTAEQREPTWVYWRARAVRAGAAAGPEGEGARGLARLILESIAGPLGFYAQLALEDLGQRVHLPPPPVPLVEAEREPVRQHAGLQRALHLMSLGLRAEGVREWNYSLRGMNDRELMAAAALACEREVWDRCINTSERTRDVADVTQRYPLPYREAVLARAAESGIDPAYVYGLIRQESRFIVDARSSAGASGLMQLMPGTARWTARRAGLADWKPELVNERDVNLLLGTTYLKLVLEEFGGAQAMGAAAYNAGPARPRRWREGVVLEPAAWIEGIPFNETRDYVKKVLSNAVVYAARLQATRGHGAATAGAGGSGATSAGHAFGPVSLRARLGSMIGPRDPAAPAENRELP